MGSCRGGTEPTSPAGPATVDMGAIWAREHRPTQTAHRRTPLLVQRALVPSACSTRGGTQLPLTQTRPVVSHLVLGSKQGAQFALLLSNEHTNHLAAHLRHAHPAHVSNAFQPDQH